MHAYDVPRRHTYQPLPSPRSAPGPSGGLSATPIYDALYEEWVKSYRTLPGDRHGEEDWGFKGFADPPHGTGSYGSYQSTRQEPQRGSTATGASAWQPVGRVPTGHTGMHHIPAALPPGPRRGL
ncbi:hypothetical protein ACFS5L_13645 [Streptomyces phyllanthi]|uniref:hypothetical protein n=1 Tax=Streptomyces phyllanthi TaxID=1803180 RepID=UPI002AD5557A|nr:hypothetical protein [Streptomyces phyllanthi]